MTNRIVTAGRRLPKPTNDHLRGAIIPSTTPTMIRVTPITMPRSSVLRCRRNPNLLPSGCKPVSAAFNSAKMKTRIDCYPRTRAEVG
jgi:hypothetical protein